MRPQRCGLGGHNVGKHGEPVLVKERYIESIRRIRKDFDPEYTVCHGCYQALKRGLLKKHLANKQNSISLGSSSQTISQSQSSSSGDPFVLTQSNGSRQKEAQLSDSDSSSIATSTEAARVPPVIQNDLYDGPSTSAAAAARQAAAKAAAQSKTLKGQRLIKFYMDNPPNATRRSRAQMIQDANDDRSPSATDGTRLPNIQPAPKRRRYVTANKDVMDIYLAGTTGG